MHHRKHYTILGTYFSSAPWSRIILNFLVRSSLFVITVPASLYAHKFLPG